jgi:hypothetical protein
MARKNPTAGRDIGMPMDEDKHEKMLSEMHDALYTLGSKIRKPIGGRGDKLLPKDLAPAEPEGAKAARNHIESLHKAMRGER